MKCLSCPNSAIKEYKSKWYCYPHWYAAVRYATINVEGEKRDE